MGAWSHEPFGNDTANDWAYGLEDVSDLSYIEQALDAAIDAGDDYLDASIAEEAVAAAEVVAQLLGKGTQSDSYTQKIGDWIRGVSARPNPALCHKAKQALQRIVSEHSELLDLWDESGQADEWKQSIERIRAAIGA